MDTSDKIASVLVAVQEAKLGTDYIKKREGYLGSVTIEDAKRVSERPLWRGCRHSLPSGRKLSDEEEMS